MLENYAIQVFLAYLVDLAVGDPRWLPHPVVVMGKIITFLEKLTRRFLKSPLALLAAGMLMAVALPAGSWYFTSLLLDWAFNLNRWAGYFLSIWLMSTTIAGRGLAGAAMKVHSLLNKGDLAGARREVGMIVGRDTDRMDKKEVTRAAVETVAENVVDAVVAPVFYAFLGGAPLAMAYRTVNTLDSMVGYKNEKYINFGMASARLDDLANFIPARITGAALVIAALILRMSPKRTFMSILRDAPAHPSPNSGIPESAVAGALGVRLGGINYYNGRESFRPYMGDEVVRLEPYHIKQTVGLMRLTSAMVVVLGVIIAALPKYF
ncbi:MAG: cobalamin biosynthesis protein CobD [Pelotomaculum sp.]|uniref:Cobalamin biosynthesis protein CobD n=1 Tax=Pelotomaculum thermopropionicum (strain DSM 13744 / JCM 10971 / SI) TaxID=370438 RepID=A5D2P5_PELTS|nr:cobalamin biosynthesis protein CobD [Pelotomaculum sp.]BAF59493.1 cobalamin biosynthesis protein CobD/CbiB [Pelotomaculum thermopropionicum SI]